MTEDLSKKIIDDLEKVGFPAEVAIASDLEQADWMVYNGALFEDSDENKTREIDVHAVGLDFSFMRNIKKRQKPGDENKLISHLTIEVKKSEKPWIFFDNGRPNWPMLPEQNFKSEQEDFPHLFEDLKDLGLKSHRYINAKLHKSFHVAFTKPTEPSMIYEALVKSTKAIKFFKKHYRAGGYALHLFIPVVVIDGTLWSATLDKNDKIKLKEVDHLFVMFGEMVKDDMGKIDYEEHQVCDVVTRKGFSKYLKSVKRNNREIYKSWTNWVNTI